MGSSYSCGHCRYCSLEILPASASYHFILLLLPLMLLLHALKIKKNKIMLLVTFAMIGFLPQWIQDHLTPGPLGSFTRLLLVTVFFILSLVVVRRKPEMKASSPGSCRHPGFLNGLQVFAAGFNYLPDTDLFHALIVTAARRYRVQVDTGAAGIIFV
jgi:hypothetical protein